MVSTRTHATLVAATILTLLLLAPPTRVAAQGNNPERARELFEQGVTAMDSGNAALAAEYFNESYQIFPRASTACNMALSLERTGRGCDAESWYRQCAVLDQEGRFRDHANRQASALGAQCQPNQAQNPFVAQATVSTANPPASTGQVQVIEQRQVVERHADHTLLGVGIAGVLLSGGALAGAIGLASAAQSERDQLIDLVGPGDPANPTPLVPGTEAADHYSQAGTFSTAAIALYAVSGVLGAVSVILILVDLAQPGAFGGGAHLDEGAGLRLAVAPTVGGAFGQLELRF